MSFGFPPKYELSIPFIDISTEQFIVIAVEVIKKLGWDLNHISKAGLSAQTGFSMSSWSESITIHITKDSAKLTSKCSGSQLTDWGKNKQNLENFVTTFYSLRKAYSPEEIEQKYLELNTVKNTTDKLDILSPLETKKSKGVEITAFFIPRKDYFITPILIDLNIAIFILMVISGVNILLPDTQSIINWGANFRPLTLEGEWWRLITNVFLHIGILHLLMNMYALLYIGLLLEPRLGRLRFAAAYFTTGLIASVTSMWWHEATVSAGASGAIFGMYGIFLAMLTTNLIEKSTRKALLSSIGIFVLYNLANGMKGGIDNAAHIGGLISGLVIGYIFYPSLQRPESKNFKYATITGLSVSAILISFLVCYMSPNDLGEYDKRAKEFTLNEAMALEIYKVPSNTPKDSLLYIIKNGIIFWEKNIKLINEMEQLKLPDPGKTHERDMILLQYCSLRIKSYNLLYQAINENSQQYRDSINFYNIEIENDINNIKGN
jgi:rhomboid protease GluP